MGKLNNYNEANPPDDLPSIDSDSRELRSPSPSAAKGGSKEKYWQMIGWAETRRGSKFLKQSIPKQFKAFNIALTNGIKPVELKARWLEFEGDKFRIEKGWDWMDVVMSFNKKRN